MRIPFAISRRKAAMSSAATTTTMTAPPAIHRATRRGIPCRGIGTDYEEPGRGVQGGDAIVADFCGRSMRTMSDAFRARSKTICFPSGLISKPHIAVW